MEYTIRFAFKRNGEILAPPRVTYSSHDAPAEVRDVYRDAVNAALARCTPLHFTDEMAGAVAGWPIAIRFVDNRPSIPCSDHRLFWGCTFRCDRYGAISSSTCAGEMRCMPPGKGPPSGTMA